MYFRTFIPFVILMVLLLSVLGASAKQGAEGSEGLLRAPQRPQKRVLLLYGMDQRNPAHELTDKGIRSVISSDQTFDIELYAEYMDSNHFQTSGYAETLARFLGEKYSDVKPDLIITTYPNALFFVLNECGQVFPRVPVVACTIYERSVKDVERADQRSRTTGVLLKWDMSGILQTIHLLKPEMHRLALVGGISDIDKFSLKEIRESLKQCEPETCVMDLSGLAMPEITERVGHLPPDCVILYSSLFLDGQQQRFVPREALSMISAAANVPVFSPFELVLGYGSVGGRLISMEAQGRKAAELAIRILAGESPGDIPFSENDTTVTLFDWRELKRWGISEARLPAGSIVRYRENSVWVEYRERIIGTGVLILLETVLIIALVGSLLKSRQMQQELVKTELRYRTVADYTYNWEYWSGPDGALKYVSPACEWITGRPPADFVGNPSLFRDIIVPEDLDVWDEHHHDALAASTTKEIRFRIRKTDGQIRWIEHSCRPVTGLEGEFFGIRACNSDITERKKAEERVKERENDLRKLTHRLIWRQEEENRRLSRELHDDLTQRLAVLAIHAGRMEQDARNGCQPGLLEFDELKNLAIRISSDVHSLSRQIHPSILDVLGLEKAIKSECARFSQREGIQVDFTAQRIPAALPKDAALSLYRIIQEGLTNIAKHACAGHTSVSLEGNGEGLFLSIRDDGIGFDEAEVRRKPGLGLSSMHERVSIIHGELHLHSEPGMGTTIEVTVPLNELVMQRD
ncbi:MAG: ATP-binding protein [Pseudomonadota bacterium]